MSVHLLTSTQSLSVALSVRKVYQLLYLYAKFISYFTCTQSLFAFKEPLKHFKIEQTCRQWNFRSP